MSNPQRKSVNKGAAENPFDLEAFELILSKRLDILSLHDLAATLRKLEVQQLQESALYGEVAHVE